MPFKKGQSGNYAGRPTDSIKAARIRKQILKAAPEIVERMIEATKSGDMNAARSLLVTVVPPLRPVELPIQLPIDGDESLTEQGRAVIRALSAGLLSPSQGEKILAGLSALAKLIELSELENRVSALEAKKP